MYRDSYTSSSKQRVIQNSKSVLICTLHLSQFEAIGQAGKSIKQFPCMLIMGNREMWFGAIFPYMLDGGSQQYMVWCHISLYGNDRN